MGLNDFVAMQEGFFAAEGLDVTFDWKTFRGTQSSWKEFDYFHRPQDRPYTEDKEDVCRAPACGERSATPAPAWAAWSPRPMAFRPGRSSCGRIRKIRKPEDLADVPIAVGMRAGSHFNVPYRLEKYLPLEHIKTVNTGGFGARLKALLDGEVEAASLLPPQIAMAEQLGLRKIIEDRFKTLWWVPAGAPPDSRARLYARAQSRRRGVVGEPAKYLPLWKLAVPPEFENFHPWDFSSSAAANASSTSRCRARSSTRVFAQVERWGLDQHLQMRNVKSLRYES